MAAAIEINDETLASLKDKIVIVTGGSSGIGLATVELLLSNGAKVVDGDLEEPPEGLSSSGDSLTFHKADVLEWGDQVALFKKAIELHGRIDHVFANAGIGPRINFVDLELDDDGDPREPTTKTLEVNLNSMINTTALAIHYIRQGGHNGSVVVNSSSTGLAPFRAVDYSVAKHGVVGLVRGLNVILQTKGPSQVRINAVAPSWTRSKMVVKETFEKMGVHTQPPEAVARAVAMLMADESRRGSIINIDHSVCKDAEEVLRPAYQSISHQETDEDKTYGELYTRIVEG
ncbi:putative 15-hydroxyprostaglandin dehydrogenase [Poronia punctata]|nr:putative 15-hydroxyprostaglandin dehydrogenase [Poronia punctata]